MARAHRRSGRRFVVRHGGRAHRAARNRALRGTYGGGRLELEGLTATWLDADLGADASFELRDGIDVDITGRWSAPLAGVASNGTLLRDGRVAEPAARARVGGAVRRCDDGHGRARGLAAVRPHQRMAEPRMARSERHREPERHAQSRGPARRVSLRGGTGALEVLERTASFSTAGTGEPLELAVARLDAATPTPAGGGTLRARRSELERASHSRGDGGRLRPRVDHGGPPGQRLDGAAAALSAQPGPSRARRSMLVALRGTLRGYRVTVGGAAQFSCRAACSSTRCSSTPAPTTWS